MKKIAPSILSADFSRLRGEDVGSKLNYTLCFIVLLYCRWLQVIQKIGPEFLRLANALSALYPKQSEEKRLLDAMLLVIPR